MHEQGSQKSHFHFLYRCAKWKQFRNLGPQCMAIVNSCNFWSHQSRGRSFGKKYNWKNPIVELYSIDQVHPDSIFYHWWTLHCRCPAANVYAWRHHDFCWSDCSNHAFGTGMVCTCWLSTLFSRFIGHPNSCRFDFCHMAHRIDCQCCRFVNVGNSFQFLIYDTHYAQCFSFFRSDLLLIHLPHFFNFLHYPFLDFRRL